MKIKFCLIFIILLATSAFGQWEKKLSEATQKSLEAMLPEDSVNYWIFLKPEAIDSNPMELSTASLDRRSVVDNQNYLINEYDYPILQSVIDEINSYGTSRNVLRWFKAVTVSADQAGLEAIANLSYVEGIDLVQSFTRRKEEVTTVIDKSDYVPKALGLDYGPSLDQNLFIRAPKLHQSGITGKGIIIAVFDTGFEIGHPVLTQPILSQPMILSMVIRRWTNGSVLKILVITTRSFMERQRSQSSVLISREQ